MYAEIEQPGSKSATCENFPVASALVAPTLRRHVATFYRFARAIDDIADAPMLAPREKIARLDGFAHALAGKDTSPGYEKAHALAESLAMMGVTDRHAHDLITAFRQDAIKSRYADWDELMAYCRLSAAPVGRYLIDLHGGGPKDYPPSDALCAVLQVINHLQDCGDDFRTLDRVYLPLDWMSEEGANVGELGTGAASAAIRRVLDRCLDGCLMLMKDARTLPFGLSSRRLSLESAVIVRIADALIARLHRQDPLASAVRLSKSSLIFCAASGIFGRLVRGH